jgi:hypothetical protein
VWEAISGHVPQGRIAGACKIQAHELHFFHWALEFPEVFARRGSDSGEAIGFDVMLGNPPWDVSEYKADSADESQPSESTIDVNEENGRDDTAARRATAKKNQFFKFSNRYDRSRGGKTNLYSAFIELCDGAISTVGAAGFVLPLGFITDETTATLFGDIAGRQRLQSVKGFENEEKVFPGIHNQTKFCLFTFGGNSRAGADYLVFARRVEHLSDADRWYDLTAKEIELFNPNTHTAPLFRARSDKELAETLYARWRTIGLWPEDERPRFKRGFTTRLLPKIRRL